MGISITKNFSLSDYFQHYLVIFSTSLRDPKRSKIKMIKSEHQSEAAQAAVSSPAVSSPNSKDGKSQLSSRGNIDLEAGDGRMLPPGITITVQAGTGDKDSDSCSWSTIALVVVVLLCGAFFWHSKITEANREAKKSSGTSKDARRAEPNPEPKEGEPKKSSEEAKKSSEDAKKSSDEPKKSSEESEEPSEEPKKSSRLKIIGMAAGAISLLTMGYFGYNYYRYGEKPSVG